MEEVEEERERLKKIKNQSGTMEYEAADRLEEGKYRGTEEDRGS